MATLSPEALRTQLGWRAAIKKFDPARKIDPELWRTLEDALVLSPSSYGMQPWRFVVVDDPAVRAELRVHSWDRAQVTDASHLVVLARRAELTHADVDRHLGRITEVRGIGPEALAGFRTMINGHITAPTMKDRVSEWNARQVYIALGFFLSACAVLGVDACPMEGFDAAAYDRVLGLPEQGYLATVVAAAGYRRADDPSNTQKKVRYPREHVVVHV